MERAQAWSIVEEFTQSESLKRHMLAVETAMRAYAPRFNGDPELWGTVGLLHDFDYEQNPDVSVEGIRWLGRAFCASAASRTRSFARFWRMPPRLPGSTRKRRWKRRSWQ